MNNINTPNLLAQILIALGLRKAATTDEIMAPFAKARKRLEDAQFERAARIARRAEQIDQINRQMDQDRMENNRAFNAQKKLDALFSNED